MVRPLGEYRSSYKLEGQTLRVERSILWRVPGSVCTRQTADDLSPVSQAAIRDTGNRLIIVNVGEEGQSKVRDDTDGSSGDGAN